MVCAPTRAMRTCCGELDCRNLSDRLRSLPRNSKLCLSQKAGTLRRRCGGGAGPFGHKVERARRRRLCGSGGGIRIAVNKTRTAGQPNSIKEDFMRKILVTLLFACVFAAAAP